MDVTARGWGRDHGSRPLVNADLYKEQKRESIMIDEVAVNRTDSGVEIWWGKSDIRFTGRYFFSLALSRGDIARLFVDAFADADLKTILTLLEGAGEKEAFRRRTGLPSDVAA